MAPRGKTEGVYEFSPPPVRGPAVRPGRGGVMGAIGRTPLVELERYLAPTGARIWAKLEGCNPGGSSKARSAARIVLDAIESGQVGAGTTIVESTSGNMGVGLAQVCRYHGLELICVSDARSNHLTIQTMRALGATVEVIERGETPGCDLLTARLARVERLLAKTDDAFWPNQYENLSNAAAHADGTMREIDEALQGRIDHLIVAAGTAGTLRGCIYHLDRQERSTTVTAVDAEGSVLFGGVRGKRLLPGMGAGRSSAIARGARPDRVEWVSDLECVIACRRLAEREAILAGASSGGVLAALERLAPALEPGDRCALILADGGTAYLDTVFDDEWVESNLGCSPERLAALATER